MKQGSAFAILALLGGLSMSGCTSNPMGTAPGPSPLATATAGVTGYFGVTEVMNNSVLYSPTTAGSVLTNPTFQPGCALAPGGTGGTISYSFGGNSGVYISTAPGILQFFGQPGVVSPNLNVMLGTPGIGGPMGDFKNDYYLIWRGHQGPNASTDYNSLVINFAAGTYTTFNLSCSRGFMFYARGNGNFGVQLGATGAKTTGYGPYTDYNYYEYDFGSQLSPTEWKQFVVNFSDMQQMYGQAVDLQGVLKNAFGLGFLQETPYVQTYELDVDYIRFF
jgi:hypothetical protein